MTIKFIKTHENAILPRRAHDTDGTGDSGYDLFSVENVVIPARGSTVVPVGLKVGHIDAGYWFKIEPRSGLGFKKGLQPHLGVIDNGYRGDLATKIYNFSDVDVEIKAGTAIAQFVVYQLIPATIEFTEETTNSDRGEKGFGSSGI